MLKKYLYNPKLVIKDQYLKRSHFYKNYCGDLPLFRVDSRIAISDSNPKKYMFFRIPKAANSTVISSLYFNENKTEAKSWEDIALFKNSYSRPSQGYLKKNCLNDYFKFTIVRNPLKRCLSAYQDKILRECAQKKLVTNFLKIDAKSTVTLNQFLDFLEFGEGMCLDGHFAMQSDLCFFDINEIDFIGKFETLDSHIRIILESIYGSKYSIKSWNVHKTKNSYDIDDLSEKRIKRLYRNDYEKFEYL
tara:strand:- start:480 stop:1220 length:741 start_codon:yes stop_codon:yes gene_type:complete